MMTKLKQLWTDFDLWACRTRANFAIAVLLMVFAIGVGVVLAIALVFWVLVTASAIAGGLGAIFAGLSMIAIFIGAIAYIDNPRGK